jgi:hypothetical protein
MNEIGILVTTTLGLAVILLVCILLLGFIVADLLKEVKFNNTKETGKRIFNYFSKKDEELD